MVKYGGGHLFVYFYVHLKVVPKLSNKEAAKRGACGGERFVLIINIKK